MANLFTHTSIPGGNGGRRILTSSMVLLAVAATVGAFLAPVQDAQAQKRLPAIELDGGTGWVNTDNPLSLKELRGRIVVLEFWTECCINCMHVFPDLLKLEKKYPFQLVVIGIHTPKFDHEKALEIVQRAAKRYGLPHPIINDSEHKIWKAYNVQYWPSVIVIDPEGFVAQGIAQEHVYDKLDATISQLIRTHRAKRTLIEGPSRFQKAVSPENTGALSFPGKVLADAAGNRLFIADSSNHRVVVTDLEGKKIAVAGSGKEGLTDGAFDKASFNEPQGMALVEEVLYVADRKNHVIRALDLKAQTVKTIAGTGKRALWPPTKAAMSGGNPRTIPLNSPWDVLAVGKTLYIAMAGHHQVWALNLKQPFLGWIAGDAQEDLGDGPRATAKFAQPSGLTTDGQVLYVADSETSAIRAMPLANGGAVHTIVGMGLFAFGDIEGVGKAVRLQHPIGLLLHDRKLYVADTYNDKIKVLDPVTGECRNFVGGGKGADALFNEPSGLSYANGNLYVADTNAHRIQVVNLQSREVSTLNLQGVEAPKR